MQPVAPRSRSLLRRDSGAYALWVRPRILLGALGPLSPGGRGNRRALLRGMLPSRAVRLAVLLSALLGPLPQAGVEAQAAPEKRPLTIAEYRMWRSISGAEISPDGRWAAWTYTLERGDDTLHVAALDSDTGHVVPLGSGAQFSDDGRWVAYFLSLPFRDAERARADNTPVTRKAELLDLASGEQVTWDDASSFGFAKGSSHFFVKKRRPEAAGARGAGGQASGAQASGAGRPQGSDLILRNLVEGYDELLGSVDEHGFNKAGTLLAYTVDAADRDGNGLYLADLRAGTRRALDNAKERYARLTWSEDGRALAVLRGDTPDKMLERSNTLLAWVGLDAPSPRRGVFGPEAAPGLPEGKVLSEKAGLTWSEDLATVFVGIKDQEDKLEDWPKAGLPLADVNIWHWADDRIQAAQQQQASRDRDRTYVAAVRLAEDRMVPLADQSMRTVELTRSGRWGIGRDDSAYVHDWKPNLADYYRIDTRTGERNPILRAHLRDLGLSPDSQHFLYWLDGHVWAYRLDNDQHVNLTASSPVDFTNQEYDHFGEKPPYGLAGWSKDGASVILNHRYDLWVQPLDGRPGTNLTQNRGFRDDIRFRYVRTDPEERAIDLDAPILLSAYGEWTKKEGFFELRNGQLRELAWEDRKFGRPQKALDAERYLFTVQTFRDFPDLWVSGRELSNRQRVTTANPQQEEYLWGSRILFDYINDDGVRLQGTLAIPDTYREGQKLPMLVRFYEKYSQDLHVHPTPGYRHSPNFAGYVSNGYLVMQPDIHFRVGSSHSDMLECVEAAVRKVIEMGYADPAAVGLSGHSYSGGGGAYIATRSKMFAAVAHGAAPINLVSEFNQLFVGSGQNNHSYDIYGQGRYGTNPYDDFQLYWDQSPISGVETMDTPVLYLHGEDDPTVNWEQGLEWYNALRFLGKPVIWLSYPGEGHGLRKLENRIDFQYRLREFFDHHLKGAPAPRWMTEGVPFLEKERHLREYAPEVFGAPPDTARSGPSGGSSPSQDLDRASPPRDSARLSPATTSGRTWDPRSGLP
jgi:dipeptidyl aminopeptidase/acylaminoacyl peptidase